MDNASDNRVAPDKLVMLGVDLDDLLDNDTVDKLINAGKITRAEADELLQAADRRDVAEHGPASDTDADGTTTEGGFGTGQGMASQSKRHGNVY